jgi:two-component system NtrC family response regulator
MASILIIDDDDLMVSTLELMIRRLGHEAASSGSLGEGVGMSSSEDFDVVFLDVRMPDGNGLEAISAIAEAPSRPEVIIITGFGEPDGAELAIKSGAWDYLEKGSSVKEMTLSLERALQYRREKKARSLKQSVCALKREDIYGNSPKLMACLNLLAQAAGSDANILITGETGTGKELFAQAIHRNSPRADRNFVVVDCAALPETLAESLLFGHEKGSFTGAEKTREGMISQAHGGTLFLDEVGELPLSLQKTFLRVLQERRFRPLGSAREVESDFRLVAATNRNLEEMAARHQFRSDLLFRLRSFAIDLPPLRERTEDIKEIARTQLDRLCECYGLPSKGFSPEFCETLMAYHWPGNVRELANTLVRAFATARFEPTIYPKHLPPDIRVHIMRNCVGRTPSKEDGDRPGEPPRRLPKFQDYRETVYAEAEKHYLHDLMSLAEESIPEACRLSGLSQSRLYALLKKHRIERRDPLRNPPDTDCLPEENTPYPHRS